MKEEQINILLVEPRKAPRRATIENNLKSLQAQVGGYIECVYPWEDLACIICGEESKLQGLPLNRGLFDEDGKLYDIIAGTFLVAGLPKDCGEFISLTEEQFKTYEKLYQRPEQFIRIGKEILRLPLD
jgi:hypothetical protein